MKFCTNCGAKLSEETKFCTNCGAKILDVNNENNTGEEKEQTKVSELPNDLTLTELKKLNNAITLKNNQTGIVKKAIYSAIFFGLVILVAIMGFDALPIHPSIVMISIFFLLMSLVIAFMFRSREKKLQSLISGENLIAAWTLTDNEKHNYVNFLYSNEKSKNIGLLIVISVLAIVIFGIFILVIDEGKLFMFLALIGLLVFVSFFAFGMPYYYRNRNLKNDGKILIGKNFAYINGFFHNWDFPLSGIKKVKVIKEPFYGLYIKYYYTDRTFTNTEELNIPASEWIDLSLLVAALNKK
ncbi:zinc ribbon domain-containing protein [Lutibacter maritimus]|uniref:Zinc-ribbon domain-containing protein n=1 Tax=Lutibacter maritimus TaxID=593133 RepID=A0A1I6R6G5_9FLAO|nr:zinc ribbon domain-containing protein [Lutibacter maritimus]SFS60307.1 zinc-ribbon domain-containing protein [Lutibacter maritimus]